MFVRFFNVCLFVGFCWGALQIYGLSDEDARLRAEHDRLVKRVGRLEIKDPEKIYLLPLETDDPLHFKWRCRLPETKMLKVVSYRGGRADGSHTSSGLQAGIQVAPQVRLRLSPEKGVQVYSQFAGGSQLASVYPSEFAQFLIERWDELDIEVAASDGQLLVSDPKRIIKLLEIRVPDALIEDYVQRDSRTDPKMLKVPFSIYFGDEESSDWKNLPQ